MHGEVPRVGTSVSPGSLSGEALADHSSMSRVDFQFKSSSSENGLLFYCLGVTGFLMLLTSELYCKHSVKLVIH